MAKGPEDFNKALSKKSGRNPSDASVDLAELRQQKLRESQAFKQSASSAEDAKQARMLARLRRAGVSVDQAAGDMPTQNQPPSEAQAQKATSKNHQASQAKIQQVNAKAAVAKQPLPESAGKGFISPTKKASSLATQAPSKDDKTRMLRSPAPEATRIKAPAQQSDADATRIQVRGEAKDRKELSAEYKGSGRAPNEVPDKEEIDDKTQISKKSSDQLIDADKTLLGSASTASQRIDHTDSTAGRMRIARAKVEKGELVLKERFVLEQLLGAGGMGMVYKARDLLKVEAMDRDPYVAVKVLNEEFRTHPEAFISLQRESRKSQRIAHPNIVNVHDFDRDGDDVFMTMEFLDGVPLDKMISQYRSTGLAKDEAIGILDGLCSALEHAHNENIIHSDFKPGNIFVTSKGQAKVFDFGIARAVAQAESYSDDPKDQTVFDAGNLGALTPTYASKEMLEGETPDVRDDIYALGCIAYEMFTGKHPFGRVNALDAAKKNLTVSRPANLNKYEWQAIEKALSFNRADRVQSVGEFWRLFTYKRGSYLGYVASSLLFVALAGFAGYNYLKPEPVLDEAGMRESIERQLRLEQQQENLDALIAAASFTEEWEATLFRYVTILRERLGTQDAWLGLREDQTLALYQARIEAMLDSGTNESIDAALSLIENAQRYGLTADQIANFEARIISLREAIAEEKRRKAAAFALQKKAQEDQKRLANERSEKRQVANDARSEDRRNRYDVAMATVEKQLVCRNTINMSDIQIAVKKLKSIDGSRFAGDQTALIRGLARCINKIGRSYPDKALSAKQEALTLFPGNSLLTGIKVAARQGCSAGIAGQGARGKRATCRDEIAAGGFGPLLVVVPAGGGARSFAISKYEITNADMKTFCSSNGGCGSRSATSLPAANLSLPTVRSYLRWLSDNSGKVYRLPSASEWKYAARAGGQSLDSNRNCKLSSRGIEKGGRVLKATIGRQNKWGLVNTAGNIQELVSTGGRGVAAAGGSFDTPLAECTANTLTDHDGSADSITGFRVLRQL